MTRAGKTTSAWDLLDERHRLGERLSHDEVVTLSADEIRDVGKREPRLMTKFDTRESRPPVLASATVLPLTNGTYAFVPGDGYLDVPPPSTLKRWAIPSRASKLQTLPWAAGPASEPQALDMALASGIFDDFFQDRDLALTVRGRRRAPAFEFEFTCRISSARLSVDGVQVEVDSGLEGDAIHLVEAKLGTRTNFHVRQLYYPFRMWRTLAPSKNTTMALLTWHDHVFSLRRYTCSPEERYQGVQLVASADYVFDDSRPVPSINDALRKVPVTSSPSAPFPQADNFARVIDVIDAFALGATSLSALSLRFAFVGRQASYYRDAARYLGMLELSGDTYELSALGEKFAKRGRNDRHAMLIEAMASLPVFRDALEWFVANGQSPPKDVVVSLIQRQANLSEVTAGRRASTVIAWTRWAMGVTSGVRQ